MGNSSLRPAMGEGGRKGGSRRRPRISPGSGSTPSGPTPVCWWRPCPIGTTAWHALSDVAAPTVICVAGMLQCGSMRCAVSDTFHIGNLGGPGSRRARLRFDVLMSERDVGVLLDQHWWLIGHLALPDMAEVAQPDPLVLGALLILGLALPSAREIRAVYPDRAVLQAVGPFTLADVQRAVP